MWGLKEVYGQKINCKYNHLKQEQLNRCFETFENLEWHANTAEEERREKTKKNKAGRRGGSYKTRSF